MAQNFICEGTVIPYIVAGAPVVSGDLVLVGALVGVTLNSGAIGATVQVRVTGVFQVPKATGAITVGAKLYYDSTAKNLTTTVGSNTLAGYAYAPALSGDATVQVKFLAQ